MSALSPRQFDAHVAAYAHRPDNAELADPDVAMGQCVDERDRLGAHLRARGVETRTITVRGGGGLHTAVMGRTSQGWRAADTSFSSVDFGAHGYPYTGRVSDWRDRVKEAMG